jgi:hypothetical protein
VQVTAVWLDASKLANESADFIKKQVQHTGERTLPKAVEKSFAIHDLHGQQTVGSYYSLTDRDPGPSFAHLTQGIFLTGPILAPFTILYRASDSPEVAQALQAFANATYMGK